MESCGYGSVIDIGCGEGFLVAELLGRGVDAFGVDVSAVVVDRANLRYPRRFFEGSVLSMPFPDEQFNVVVSTDCMEHLAPADVPVALREMYRVSSRYVFLQIATTNDRDGHWHLTVESREWWEARCFEAGFRKHPLYYYANPYEALNQDGWQILILLEKVPKNALLHYDLSVLSEERLLHSDMLREVGRRSDAHCIRYHKAAELVRPGDRVLDVACGLGYGSHILYTASQAESIVGVDLSDFGIKYASAHYGRPGRLEFLVGDAEALSQIEDSSVDFITAFETIEHLPEPIAYLQALKRVLKPSGRVMICAPNNWADETGEDPNPHHLHVYTWDRLLAECGAYFLLERGFLQTAGGAMRCHFAPRSWVEVSPSQPLQQDSEWILLVGMADPLAGKDVPYTETCWALPPSADFHVSAFARDYANPWLVKSMVAMGMRATSRGLLSRMRERVLSESEEYSVDYGAALCGSIYTQINEPRGDKGHAQDLEARARRYSAIEEPSPHQLRWQVSLFFARAEMARLSGDTQTAIDLYEACIAQDVMVYSPLLGNKTLDALHWLAILAINSHDTERAKGYLQKAVSEAIRLASGSWLNVVGNPKAPLPFGFSEMAQLMDKASRAAYMLKMLDVAPDKPGIFHRESHGFFERQMIARDRQIHDIESSKQSLLSLVAEKDNQLQTQIQEVIRLNRRTQELASEVVQQDAHAQELARQIRCLEAGGLSRLFKRVLVKLSTKK
jgi:ubiquinone/menaquinone biosynthesis C-methylase UbiE